MEKYCHRHQGMQKTQRVCNHGGILSDIRACQDPMECAIMEEILSQTPGHEDNCDNTTGAKKKKKTHWVLPLKD